MSSITFGGRQRVGSFGEAAAACDAGLTSHAVEQPGDLASAPSTHDLGSRLAADISTTRRGLAGPGPLAQNRLAAAQADARGHVTAAGKAAHDAVALGGPQRALTKANTDYANLLGLTQRAVAWELPGGVATNVTEQEGSFIYTIAGS